MQPLAAKDEISKLQFDSYIAASRVADSDSDGARSSDWRIQRSRQRVQLQVCKPQRLA